MFQDITDIRLASGVVFTEGGTLAAAGRWQSLRLTRETRLVSARPARIHTATHLNSRLSKVGFKKQ